MAWPLSAHDAARGIDWEVWMARLLAMRLETIHQLIIIAWQLLAARDAARGISRRIQMARLLAMRLEKYFG